MAGVRVMAGQIQAKYRPKHGRVRVWWRLDGQAEDFTLAEVRLLCVAGDRELMLNSGTVVSLWFPCDDERGRVIELMVGRAWLIDFLRAVRSALRVGGAPRDLTTEVAA